eukprot:m.47590 g.47590  ORF g.47590 m.47590 type:complete len:82 (-) comp11932_c0_seq2:1137-1382(-)
MATLRWLLAAVVAVVVLAECTAAARNAGDGKASPDVAAAAGGHDLHQIERPDGANGAQGGSNSHPNEVCHHPVLTTNQSPT